MKIDQAPHNDPEVWALYHEGNTKGVFQLESNLGKSWSKKVKPNNIEELAGLVSIIRPGTLKAKQGDKTLSQIYVDRKHGIEPIEYLHESLEEILSNTYGVLVYQEQAMRIAQKLARFSESDADVLRKAIGKKKADLMAAVRKDFITGCEKVGIVDADTANQIFDWIEKSARYSFNKSHAVAYAINSYWSAFRKTHNTKEFFVAWLQYAKEKQDPHQEVYELVSASKLFDFEIKTPKITNFKDEFNYYKGAIYFGLKDIKSLTGKNGDKAIKAVEELKNKLGKKIESTSWLEILIYFSTEVNSTVFKTLASIGFFRGLKDKVTRNQAIYEYEIFRILTKTELAWVEEHYPKRRWKSLLECFEDLAPTKKEGGGTFKESRKQIILNEIKMLKNPPYDLSDDPDWVIDQETKFLGCPVSMSKIDTVDAAGCNTTCKELIDGKRGKNLRIAANITRIVNFKIKKDGPSKGKEMAFLTVEDDTCALDSVVVFPECREENKYSLFEGNNVILQGSCEKKDDTSFIVEKIFEL